MPESFKIPFFIIFGIGWVFFFSLSFTLIKKFAAKEDINKQPVTLIDVPFFILSCYAFYSLFFGRILSELVSNNTTSLFGKVLSITLYLIAYLGMFGAVAYIAPIARTYFRYGIGLLVAYALFTGTVGILISGNGGYAAFYLQGWDIYQWFLMVLFPLEIGAFVRRVVVTRLKRVK